MDARDADSFSDLQDRQDAAYASLNVDCNALEVSEPSPALKVVHNALKVEVAPGKDIHFQRTRRESTSVWAMKEDLDGLKDAASSAAAAIAQLQAASGTVADNIAENAEAAKAGTDGATEKVAELTTTVDELAAEVSEIADQVAELAENGGSAGGNAVRVPFVVAAAHEGEGSVNAITVGDDQAVINVVGENLMRGVSVSNERIYICVS